MILLLNSAVMPTEGVYTLKRISEATFRTVLQGAAAAKNFQSYIGYPETAHLIEEFTGIEVEVSREQATLAPGDIILIVKLRHRVANPTDKDIPQLSIGDFEFFWCDWKPLEDGGATHENVCDIFR
ncbi:hypothetical protein C6503_03645 [Candidatus Poribacteria bacterium]|nr:MAG: hypothetical protein C6503_03645 [Candidatus Poribacteria bacterium]